MPHLYFFKIELNLLNQKIIFFVSSILICFGISALVFESKPWDLTFDNKKSSAILKKVLRAILAQFLCLCYLYFSNSD